MYLFTRSGTTWSPETVEVKLTATDGVANDVLGRSVSLSGNTVAAGAPHVDGATGAVYVFTRSGTTWSAEADEVKLTDPDGDDLLGWSVSLSADTIAAGAPGAIGSGSVSVFTRSGPAWGQEAKLTVSAGQSYVGYFGVSISGDILAVGARHDGEYGAVYVFTRIGTTWIQEAKLTDPNGVAFDGLGYNVSINGNTLAVGAPYGGAGFVYVFTRIGMTWIQEAKLTDPDGVAFDGLGYSVSIDGATLAGGAPSTSGSSSGSVSVFTSN